MSDKIKLVLSLLEQKVLKEDMYEGSDTVSDLETDLLEMGGGSEKDLYYFIEQFMSNVHYLPDEEILRVKDIISKFYDKIKNNFLQRLEIQFNNKK